MCSERIRIVSHISQNVFFGARFAGLSKGTIPRKSSKMDQKCTWDKGTWEKGASQPGRPASQPASQPAQGNIAATGRKSPPGNPANRGPKKTFCEKWPTIRIRLQHTGANCESESRKCFPRCPELRGLASPIFGRPADQKGHFPRKGGNVQKIQPFWCIWRISRKMR